MEIAAPHVMQEDFRHKNAPGLAAVNQCLAFGAPEAPEHAGFFVTPAAGVYAECKAVACRIAALVRERGLRYGGVAVICREMDAYAAPLQYEFALAGIPYFTDETTSPEHTAPAAFFTAALSLLSKGLSTEALLRLLKTDLCGFAPEEIAVLENYAYTWQLKAADWRAPFEKNPAGFGAQMTDEDRAALARAEALRAEVVPRVERFLDAARGQTAAGISKQLYLLLDAFSGAEHTAQAAAAFEQAGDPLRARALYATWENMMDLLGQMEQLLGGDEVTAAEYAELFALLLHEADLGHVPETQDAVIVTTADRMRLDSPDVCFVLGVSEGKFPKLLGASGLLSHADRDLLVQGGVEMPGSYENRTLLEQMFFYRALTAPAQALYVSFVPPEAGGAPLSAAMEPLVEALAPPADVLDEAQRAPTPAAALDLLGAAYREDTPQTAALEAALRRQDTMAESLARHGARRTARALFRAGDAPSGGTFGRQAHAFTHACGTILPLPVFLLSAVCPAHSSAQTRGAFSAGERQPGALYPGARDAPRGRGVPASCAGGAGPAGRRGGRPIRGRKHARRRAALCLPGGTAEARRNAFVGVSSGGAGPKPVPSGRL